MAGKYVIIHRSFDPIQAEFLGDILRENGIGARVLGTRSGALVGVAQNIMELHIEVPAPDAGAATDFLESFFQQDGAELLREHGLLDDEEEDDGDRAHAESADEADGEDGEASPIVDDVGERRPLLAAGSVLLMFGGAHLYTRRTLTTAIIAGMQAVALWHMASMHWTQVATGISLFGAMLVFDMVGGQLAARAYNRGERCSLTRQLFAGTAVAAAAFVLASQLGSRLPRPKSPRWDAPQRTMPTDFAVPADYAVP